jgi:hypothetical protein
VRMAYACSAPTFARRRLARCLPLRKNGNGAREVMITPGESFTVLQVVDLTPTARSYRLPEGRTLPWRNQSNGRADAAVGQYVVGIIVRTPTATVPYRR